MATDRLASALFTPSTNICSKFLINCCLCTLIIYVISGLGSACQFPRYLRTSAMWMAKYKDGSTLNIYFKETHIQATRCDREGSHCNAYSRKCLVKIDDDKYQVQHTPKNGHNPIKYLCMQINQRGKNIIQIRESSELVYRTPNSCNDGYLILDNWPLILTNKYIDQKIPCPFSGGYNVVFHTSDRNPKCDDQLIPARLESECEQGDGMTINFQHHECLDKGLEMDLIQNVNCEAVWTHGNYTFIMLRSPTDDYKHWCMRITGTDMTKPIKEGHLFIDLVCDPGDGNGNIRETSNYLYLEFDQRVVSSTCQDAYSKICTDPRACVTDTEDGTYKLHCRRYCNFCSGEEVSCTFPGNLRGKFLENSYNQNKETTIDYYSMSISDTGSFRCHEPEGHEFENNTMVFQTFENGCYPRFACFEVRKPAASILEYRLGNRVGWPIKHWDRLKEDVCADSMFEPNAKDRELYGKGITEKPTKILVDSHHHYHVNCELSSWHGLSGSRLSMHEENVCDYCFIHDPTNRHGHDSITTQTINCTSAGSMERRKYHCLGVFPQDENTHAVVTRTLHLHQEYLCWVFVYEHDNEERAGIIYVLEATHCNKVAISAVKEGSMEPKRVFIIPKSSPDKCPLLPMDTTPSTYYYQPEHHPEYNDHHDFTSDDESEDYINPSRGGEEIEPPSKTPYYESMYPENPGVTFPRYYTTARPPLYESSGMGAASGLHVHCVLTVLAIIISLLSNFHVLT